MRKTCSRCLGEGKIANTDDGEPWSAWATLPPGSDLAVRMGFVRPIDCPDCEGHGSVAVEPKPLTAREQLDAYAAKSMPSHTDTGVDDTAGTYFPEVFTALRAVLDLHADDAGDCRECGVDAHEEPIPWPCKTVTAITTALEDS
ncbi:hypothetical protein SD37_11610 [Amycolatopsis orientalis]|uniref:Uncharacterized protein n=1 Tax=Amycolatopsis orientalis TaxID=31958 RepID=A0A193BVM9_AMYOR|nr:hypothetical protein [Amycolatopsis orientalis]ANN16224.1 hypothetical protein SD37_11610 [Amycolatopsis orientalis]